MIELPKNTQLPEKFDWRKNNGNWVTPVKNQGGCGSCWAFSAVAQMESWWLIQNEKQDTVDSFDLSEQFIVTEGSAGNCSGGDPGLALEVIKEIGVPPEWSFQYQDTDTIGLEEAHSNWNEHTYQIPSWGYVTRAEASVETIKNALLYHPVSASYEVYQSFYAYDGGVYEPLDGDSLVGAHAILIVGWDSADSSWICKNSWSRYWPGDIDFDYDGIADSGYFKIKWGTCQIGKYMPFIWNNKTFYNSLDIVQSSISATIQEGETDELFLTLENIRQKPLQFAATDYAIPLYFHPDTFNAYQGTSWWCGDPEIMGYNNHVLQYLETPELDLKSSTVPVLEFKAYWDIEGVAGAEYPYDGWDGWNVRISTDGGVNYDVINPITPKYTAQSLWSFGHYDQGWKEGPDIPGWAGKSHGWKTVKFDLAKYKNDNIKIRFAFASDMGYCSLNDEELYGLFIDDIQIYDTLENGDTHFSNFGEDNGEMEVAGFGQESNAWLTIQNSPGEIPAGKSYKLSLDVDARNLRAGKYSGIINIEVNDGEKSSTSIPVNIDVVEHEQDISNINRPNKFELLGNYPNPFNASTNIEYYLPEAGRVTLIIYNLKGQKVYQSSRDHTTTGKYYFAWAGSNMKGQDLSSGVYIYRINYQNFVKSGKMLLIK